MKKLFIGFLVLVVAVAFGFGNAYAQMPSSKGSAAIVDWTLIEKTEHTNSWDPVLSTYIKVPQDKELVFDVSLECGLFTDTHVKSKGGIKDTSTAEVGIEVRVKMQEILGTDENGDFVFGPEFYAFPDGEGEGVTFCKRKQELMAKFQGIFQDCTETETWIDPLSGEEYTVCKGNSCLMVVSDDAGGYKIILDFDCLEFEEIQLIQDTVSANAFNFISANLDQGEYKVTVEAEITSSTDSENGAAAAKGLIGKGSMVVDEVRFITNDLGQNK